MTKKNIIMSTFLLVWCLFFTLAARAQEKATEVVSTPSSLERSRNVDWREVSTLDLKTAVTIALSDNPGLKAAAARVRQAKDQVDQARATYWPWLDANASGTHVKLSENTYEQNLAAARLFNMNAAIDDPEAYYSADLTAYWTLFDGFERKFTNALAEYGEQSSTASLNDARRLLISAVALSYYSAQLASANIAIAKADEAFNQRQLADAEARQRVGTGALSDVLNFQVRGNQAKTTRINQEYQHEITLYGLATLLGISESRLPSHVKLAELSPETPLELTIPKVDELISNALVYRPDIQKAKLGIKQSDAQIKIAQSDYYPAIAIAGSIGGERVSDPGFEQNDFGNTVKLGLTYNLFAGGLTRAKVSEARHFKDEGEKRLQELISLATSEIRTAAALVVTAQTQVALQRDNVDLVQRTRDLVEKEYNAGQGSLVRLNEAQRDLTTARSNLALALVGLRQAWVELKTRTGNILVAYDMSE